MDNAKTRKRLTWSTWTGSHDLKARKKVIVADYKRTGIYFLIYNIVWFEYCLLIHKCKPSSPNIHSPIPLQAKISKLKKNSTLICNTPSYLYTYMQGFLYCIHILFSFIIYVRTWDGIARMLVLLSYILWDTNTHHYEHKYFDAPTYTRWVPADILSPFEGTVTKR